MRTIAITNNKGGSGKTTTTVNLAAAFAERGLRVLVVDLDPQGSATEWLGGRPTETSLLEYSEGGMGVSNLVVGTTAPGVSLIPASPSLVPSGETGGNAIGFAIVRAFARLPPRWDLVLIDTPPVLGYLSLAPLVASTRVLIPVEGHALAIPGVTSVLGSVERAQRRVNPRLKILGILACRISRTSHTREVVTRLRAQFGGVVLEQSIREAIAIAEAPVSRLPITRFAPASAVAADFRTVAGELLERLRGARDR